MIKYWVDYVTNRGSNKVGYSTLEGFVTDIISWINEQNKDPEEQLCIYEEHNKDAGFYIIQEGISQ